MNTDMTEQDCELLSRYLDGELDGEQAQDLRARLLAEPALRADYERLKVLDSRLREAFDVPGVDSVPPAVVQMVRDAQSRPEASGRGKRAVWGLGLAASVLVAAGVMFNGSEPGQEEAQFAHLDALVAPVLESALSRGEGWETLPDGSRVRPLLSFPAVDGGWCREYLLDEGDSQWHGVACRTSGQWMTAALAPAQRADAAQGYRPAGAMTAEQVESFIEGKSADIPLSSEQEAGLIARGWK